MLSRILQSKIAVATPIVAVFCVLHVSSVSAEVYKWIDSDGRTQYSDRPPQDKRLKPTTISIVPAPRRDDVEVSASDRDVADAMSEQETQEKEASDSPDEAEARKKQENIRSAMRQRCAEARKELAILSKDIPAYLDEGDNLRLNWGLDAYDGERIYLTAGEREKALEKVKTTIDDFCQNPDDGDAQEEARRKWVRSEYCLSSQAILARLKREDARASGRTLRRQQELNDEYCDGSASLESSDLTELEIFRKPRQRSDQSQLF